MARTVFDGPSYGKGRMSGRKTRRLIRALLGRGDADLWRTKSSSAPHKATITFRRRPSGPTLGYIVFNGRGDTYGMALNALIEQVARFEYATYQRITANPARHVQAMMALKEATK